jgi:sigma-E factor negative regulatory protein RseB
MHPIPKGEKPGWVFEKMPAGFIMDLHSRRSDGLGGGIMDHFLFSDGLASVSVYVEPNGEGIGLRGGAQMGAMNAFGREVDGHQVTAVGAVPPVTVQAIAEAIRPAAGR